MTRQELSDALFNGLDLMSELNAGTCSDPARFGQLQRSIGELSEACVQDKPLAPPLRAIALQSTEWLAIEGIEVGTRFTDRWLYRIRRFLRNRGFRSAKSVSNLSRSAVPRA